MPPTPPAPRPAPRLYLVTPVIEDATGFARKLEAAIASADIAAVLLHLKDADERTLINRVKALVPVAQRAEVALVLDGYPEIAIKGGADGANLTGTDEFLAVAGGLKPERIAGCGGLQTRHDAMLAAESGADYVMFGEPAPNGERPSFDAVIERVVWWAEVFEIPCVGFAQTLDEVEPLAKAGADFVAVGPDVWDHPDGVKAALAQATAGLVAPEPTA
jgi:thiamine-phosphate pyrophosphorylase